jgi:transcription antitermination factor NusG
MSLTKQWNAVYTKSGCEKKVIDALRQKKIDSYFPINQLPASANDSKRTINQALFSSFIFVYIFEEDHAQLKKIPGILGLAYWLKDPVVFQETEISLIRNFLDEHKFVQATRIPVNMNDKLRVIGGSLNSLQDPELIMDNRNMQIHLPRLGYLLIAKLEPAKNEIAKQELPMPENFGKLAI